MASQPLTHAIAAQTLSTVFLQLGISASLFLGGDEWFPTYVHPSPAVVGFELAHGLEAERKAHNERSAKPARREGALVSEHSGFTRSRSRRLANLRALARWSWAPSRAIVRRRAICARGGARLRVAARASPTRSLRVTWR